MWKYKVANIKTVALIFFSPFVIKHLVHPLCPCTPLETVGTGQWESEILILRCGVWECAISQLSCMLLWCLFRTEPRAGTTALTLATIFKYLPKANTSVVWGKIHLRSTFLKSESINIATSAEMIFTVNFFFLFKSNTSCYWLKLFWWKSLRPFLLDSADFLHNLMPFCFFLRTTLNGAQGLLLAHCKASFTLCIHSSG